MRESVSRPEWDEVWMSFAKSIGRRSKCTRGDIGCVLVSQDNQVISASYVGPPPSFRPAVIADIRSDGETTSCLMWCPRSQLGHVPEEGYVDCVSSHAEMNAVARADFSRLADATAYVNGAVCYHCAKLLSAACVKRVVMVVHDTDAHRNPSRTLEYFKMNGVEVDQWPA